MKLSVIFAAVCCIWGANCQFLNWGRGTVVQTSITFLMNGPIPRHVKIHDHSYSMEALLMALASQNYNIEGKQYSNGDLVHLLKDIKDEITVTLNNVPFNLVSVMVEFAGSTKMELAPQSGIVFKRAYLKELVQFIGDPVPSQTIKFTVMEGLMALFNSRPTDVMVQLNGVPIQRSFLIQLLMPQLQTMNIEVQGKYMNMANALIKYEQKGVTPIEMNEFTNLIKEQIDGDKIVDSSHGYVSPTNSVTPPAGVKPPMPQPPIIQPPIVVAPTSPVIELPPLIMPEYEKTWWKLNRYDIWNLGNNHVKVGDKTMTLTQLLELLLTSKFEHDHVWIDGEKIPLKHIQKVIENVLKPFSHINIDVPQLLKELKSNKLTQRNILFLELLLGKLVNPGKPTYSEQPEYVRGILLNGKLMNPMHIIKAIIETPDNKETVFLENGLYKKSTLLGLLASLGPKAYTRFHGVVFNFNKLVQKIDHSDPIIMQLKEIFQKTTIDKLNMYIHVNQQLYYVPDLIVMLMKQPSSTINMGTSTVKRNDLIQLIYECWKDFYVRYQNKWYNVGSEVLKLKNSNYDQNFFMTLVQHLFLHLSDPSDIYITDKRYDIMEILLLLFTIPGKSFVLDGVMVYKQDLIDWLQVHGGSVFIYVHGVRMTITELLAQIDINKPPPMPTSTLYTIVVNGHHIDLQKFLQMIVMSPTKLDSIYYNGVMFHLKDILGAIYKHTHLDSELFRILKMYEAATTPAQIMEVKSFLLPFLIGIKPANYTVAPKKPEALVVEGVTFDLIEVIYTLLTTTQEWVEVGGHKIQRATLIKALKELPGEINVLIGGVRYNLFKLLKMMQSMSILPPTVFPDVPINNHIIPLDKILKSIVFHPDKVNVIVVDGVMVEIPTLIQVLQRTNQHPGLVTLLLKYQRAKNPQELYDVKMLLLQYLLPSIPHKPTDISVNLFGRQTDLLQVLYVLFTTNSELVMVDNMQIKRSDLIQILKKEVAKINLVLAGKKLDLVKGLELLESSMHMKPSQVHHITINGQQYRLDDILKHMLFSPGKPAKMILRGHPYDLNMILHALFKHERMTPEIVEQLKLYQSTNDPHEIMQIKIKLMELLIPQLKDALQKKPSYQMQVAIDGTRTGLEQLMKLLGQVANNAIDLYINGEKIEPQKLAQQIPCPEVVATL